MYIRNWFIWCDHNQYSSKSQLKQGTHNLNIFSFDLIQRNVHSFTNYFFNVGPFSMGVQCRFSWLTCDRWSTCSMLSVSCPTATPLLHAAKNFLLSWCPLLSQMNLAIVYLLANGASHHFLVLGQCNTKESCRVSLKKMSLLLKGNAWRSRSFHFSLQFWFRRIRCLELLKPSWFYEGGFVNKLWMVGQKGRNEVGWLD